MAPDNEQEFQPTSWNVDDHPGSPRAEGYRWLVVVPLLSLPSCVSFGEGGGEKGERITSRAHQLVSSSP